MRLHKIHAVLERHTKIVRIAYSIVAVILIVVTVSYVLILKMQEDALTALNMQSTPTPFPVGVDPEQKLITENPVIDSYFETKSDRAAAHVSFLSHITAKLAQFGLYQNLASPISRILVIEPGERREQVVKDFGDILHWSNEERSTFLTLVASATPSISEGKYFPGHYVVSKDATPKDIASVIEKRFNDEVLDRYTSDVSSVVPLNDALVIASLLEREAYDFEDMRNVAGVIWNRLFIGMRLQIDATLQYAKGSKPYEKWWPKVSPSDKFISSAFNTYQHEGLPPAPISNPSVAALLAALNPVKSECMYYFHDKNGIFHCSKTYKEHVALLKKYYGNGR